MKNIILCIVLLVTFGAGAQTKLKKADKLFKTYSYTEAAKAYDKYLEDENKPSIQTLKNAGDSWYLINKKSNALPYYMKAYEYQGTSLDDAHFLRYYDALQSTGNAARADQLAREYLAAHNDTQRIMQYAGQRKRLDSIAKAKALYTIRDLNSNSKKSDFGAAFYGDKIVYASSKDTTKYGEKLYNWNKQPYLDMYVAERNNNNGELLNETVFLPEIETPYHDATVAFSPDLQTVYYSTSNVKNKGKKLVTDKEGTNNFKIVKATLSNGKATGMKDLFKGDTYSAGHPAVSPDGKWLFFASDMPGGMGGSDIYIAQIGEDGTVWPPKNAGPMINTAGNEMFPSVMNGMLYFASDGRFGMGGLDIYMSAIKGDEFGEPKNLGAPVNSSSDDFAYIVDKGDAYGYFSSNRPGGVGDDDIYFFTKVKAPCDEMISGTVTNIKSKQPIEGATVTVEDLFGATLTTAQTDTEGKYTVTLPCGKTVKMSATKANYSKQEKEEKTGNRNGNETKDVNFELVNYDDLIVKKDNVEKIDINTIYFDYNKWDITPQAATELDKVIYAMTNFPKLRIKIESHTDSRGKDAYNLKLSDNRAKATQTYILSKGIDASRIESAIGYGETRLVNKCSNGVKCTEEEHAANRRSDFIVIEK